MQFNSLSDNAERLKFLTFVVFLFQIIKNGKFALSEKMGTIGLPIVICYLGLKGLSPKELTSSPCCREGHPPLVLGNKPLRLGNEVADDRTNSIDGHFLRQC